MMTDPIADMLTRIRNAVRVERPTVTLPVSKVKCGLAEVLKREGYIWDWHEVKTEGHPQNELHIDLKYGPNGERVIRHIKRVSKPGCRVYARHQSLRPVLNGLGISVISTSRGVISDREARQRKLGGEVLCELW
ncbi:30S ribosomal protein S8 [Aeoliella sp. SH292]|jgi:small subunit ribosomal protein S8|uniref:30S ribosomal protein S8 n=1 Tax=Aeoliella sp. SH292 TaxID=3454464 RepID=UPI003F95376B